MPRCLVYYGTSEGQTAKIAARIGERLRAQSLEVEVVEGPREVDPSRFDAVVIGDSIHITRYHRHVVKFVRSHRAALEARPNAFFTVCMSIASQREEDREAALRLVDGLIGKTGWQPAHTVTFAGAVPYTKYGPLTRFVMRRISAAEGGSTDTSRDHEYTDWDAVDAFADGFARDLLARAPTVAASR